MRRVPDRRARLVVVAIPMRLALSMSLALTLVACNSTPPEAPAPSSPASAPSEEVGPSASAPVAEAALAPSAAEPTLAPSASAAALEPSAAPSAEPELAEAPLPEVEVKNIGMHIGGGPNDAVSKRPIADSVSPHFDELRRCYAKVDDQTKSGDFGLDLLIPHDGGKATTSHPRSVLKGEGFRECVVAVFDQIEFLKPKTGKTMVSYSVRFTPKGAKK